MGFGVTATRGVRSVPRVQGAQAVPSPAPGVRQAA